MAHQRHTKERHAISCGTMTTTGQHNPIHHVVPVRGEERPPLKCHDPAGRASNNIINSLFDKDIHKWAPPALSIAIIIIYYHHDSSLSRSPLRSSVHSPPIRSTSSSSGTPFIRQSSSRNYHSFRSACHVFTRNYLTNPFPTHPSFGEYFVQI